MGMIVPPTLKEVMEKCRERGDFVFTKEQHDAILKTLSTLPANTLEDSCYAQMFSGCTTLTTAPTFPILKTIEIKPKDETDEKPSKMTAEAFDGFDWNKDMEDAFKIE